MRSRLGTIVPRGVLRVLLAVVLLSAFAAAVEPAPVPAADELRGRALVDALRRGGYVLYFRHAATDFSQSDTDTRNLANCRTQRNLNQRGRRDARAIGRAVQTLRVPVGTVLSSKYCRARQTALLAFGRAKTTIDLTGLPSAATQAESARRVRALRRMLARTPAARTNTVLVAHLFNIQEAANVSLDEGEAAVFLPSLPNRYRLVASIAPREWVQLAASFGKNR
jgi:phosphohistidine phosphatase SixA